MAESKAVLALEERIVAAEHPSAARAGRADLEKVLAAFCGRHGLPELRLDEDGFLDLSLGDELNVVIFLPPDTPVFLLIADMPAGCTENRDILFEALMENRSVLTNAGGTFGKVPGKDTLQFFKMVMLAGLDDAMFERELMSFAEIAANWVDHFDFALKVAEDKEIEGLLEAEIVPPFSAV